MTLIVGMHLGSYVLLAADTRVTYYPNDIRMFRDDSIKIRRTSMGIISGAGLTDLLDPVKDRLNEESITVIDRIVEVVQEQVTAVKKEPWATHPRVADAIQQTGWMCTFVGSDNGTVPPTHPLRLGIVGTQEVGVQSLAINDVYLLAPTGTTPEQWRAWYRFAKDNLRPLDEKPDVAAVGDNIAHHAKVVQELMERVSSLNDGVAETFQIGVHIVPWLTGISSIIKREQEVTFDWDDGTGPLSTPHE